MSKERELLARVAFETVHNNGITEKLYGEIEAYLAEPVQEPKPVAYINGTYGGRICIKLLNQSLVVPDGMALYATPLNMDEIRQLLIRYREETPLGHQPHMLAHLADAAIAKATGVRDE